MSFRTFMERLRGIENLPEDEQKSVIVEVLRTQPLMEWIKVVRRDDGLASLGVDILIKWWYYDHPLSVIDTAIEWNAWKAMFSHPPLFELWMVLQGCEFPEWYTFNNPDALEVYNLTQERSGLPSHRLAA